MFRRDVTLATEYMNMESLAQAAYRSHAHRFSTSIWHCCRRFCFASVASDAEQCMLLDELIQIHQHANRCHRDAEEVGEEFQPIRKRRKGIGRSHVAFAAPGRKERELVDEKLRSIERNPLRTLSNFIEEVLPFLYGQADSPTGTKRPSKKLCTHAICSILGVSRNYLYNRQKILLSSKSTDEDLRSVIDSTGLRLRQHRRNADRRNYPPLHDLPDYQCGCDVPCFAEVPHLALVREYTEFARIAKQLKPRHKENRFLLNRLFCPLTSSTVLTCNRALSALYTVSESLISDVRRALNKLCVAESSEDTLETACSGRYSYFRGHPMNRFPESVRERIESHLDMVLRADPAGSSGESVCRVYSPELNTQEKLRESLRNALMCDVFGDTDISASSLQRMVNEYLRERNFMSISFAQSDHNACPTCKTLQMAVLQYHHDHVFLKREWEVMLKKERPMVEKDQLLLEEKRREMVMKKFQEDVCVRELQKHNIRDAHIRGYLKRLSDHFRGIENKYRQLRRDQAQLIGTGVRTRWCQFLDRACILHQDDMTKVDLPQFVVSASSDITRWRFGVNAHVSSVTNDATIFSCEQGAGPKNSSSILEKILLNHLLQCTGESILVVVSDNAAVGKNWLTTVAFPQYVVDQGLAEIVVMAFLENNHGKWLADMLFGQFQTRRKRSLILGIDDMLCGFEGVRRKQGSVSGFAVNPLASVEFSEVFRSLGYATKPPAEFGFNMRNIHFASACSPQAKARLPVELQQLLTGLLREHAGMVRISSEPPRDIPQCELPYSERYCDVPARDLSTLHRCTPSTSKEPSEAPLTIPLEQPYSASGPGVVSTRTAEHVGYNGLEFRKLRACPELGDTSKRVVREAWPKGLLDIQDGKSVVDVDQSHLSVSESRKCAPINWIVRRPVRHFSKSENDCASRYPPANLLNARFRRPPGDMTLWIPSRTYEEPPFPILEGRASF